MSPFLTLDLSHLFRNAYHIPLLLRTVGWFVGLQTMQLMLPYIEPFRQIERRSVDPRPIVGCMPWFRTFIDGCRNDHRPR